MGTVKDLNNDKFNCIVTFSKPHTNYNKFQEV